MSKKKNKKTPKNTNHQKNTDVIKEQTKSQSQAKPKVEATVVEQPVKSENKQVTCNCFKKCLISVKHILSKVKCINKVIKNHKKIFGCIFVVMYTCAVVFLTLGVEHYILPFSATESIETQQAEIVEVQQFKMEQGQVYRVSPECVLQYEGFEFTSTIKPKNVEKAGEYFGQSYVNENEDNIYLDVVFKYTNKSSEPVRGDQIISVLTTAGGKSYEDIFTAIENADRTEIDFSSAVEISQGDYALVHCVFDVPKEVQDMTEIKAEVSAYDKSYVITIGNEQESEPKVEQVEPSQNKRQTLTK